MKTLPIVLIIFIALYSCNPFPKDADGTLSRVQNKVLVVGVSAYDSTANAAPRNLNKELFIIGQIAKGLNAKVVWVRGSQSELVQLVYDRKIHMAIGGFKSPSPFEKEVSFTLPFQLERIRVGLTKPGPVPEDIKGKKVVVTDILTSLYVEKKDGIPLMSASLLGKSALVAASEEKLKSHRLVVTDIILKEVKHVIAVKKGENAFLIKLENLIDKYGQPE
jgi:polar amino acid transport system substrate-binding protein